MTEPAGCAGKSLAVPARAVVLVRTVTCEGVVVLAVREDRGRSGTATTSMKDRGG
jgi:hypothetical protein